MWKQQLPKEAYSRPSLLQIGGRPMVKVRDGNQVGMSRWEKKSSKVN